MSRVGVAVQESVQDAVAAPAPLSQDHYIQLAAEAERLAGFGLWRWEISTGAVQWSENLERIYGLAPGTFPGTVEAFVGYLHPEDRRRVAREVERTVRTGEPFVRRERVIGADGRQIVLLSCGRAVRGEDGSVRELIGVCHDITCQVAAQTALDETQARLEAIIENSPSLIAVKDVEHRYVMANAETSRLLGVPMEQIIGRSCRALFPTICEQIIEAEDRALAGEGPVVDDVELIVERERRTYRTVTFTLPGATGEAAEICTIATDVTERRAAEHACSQRRHWERVIDAALAEGRMRVYGQPVVSLATGTAGNAGPATPRELLVRMVSESGELLLPADFLPEAERHGLIGRIDVWMVRQAVRLARSHQVSVNLSPLTISDDGAREQVLEVVRGAQDLPSGRLIFELTETAAPGDLDVACRFAAQVQALGGRLALDDFGTGFGSFTYLRRMPLCFLKIDASFVRHSSDSAADRAVVRSMVDIARQFGLRTVAEGVEDAFTLALIRDAGVDNAQGYLLGVPAEMSLPD